MNEQQDFNSMSTSELAKYFISQLELKERMENEITVINKKIQFIDSTLYEKMDDDDIEYVNIDNIKLSKVIDEQFVLNTSDEKEKWDTENGAFFNWLKEIGEDGLIKTKLSVHHQTRTAFLKEMLDKGQSLPEFIKSTFWNHVKYNKSEIKRRVASE